VDDEAAAPVMEEVLAPGLRALEPPPVEAFRLPRKAALRRAHANAAAAEVPRMDAGQTMDRVSFGHPGAL
jgi:hypothetical protein